MLGFALLTVGPAGGHLRWTPERWYLDLPIGQTDPLAFYAAQGITIECATSAHQSMTIGSAASGTRITDLAGCGLLGPVVQEVDTLFTGKGLSAGAVRIVACA